MKAVRDLLARSPAAARAVPFILFLGLTFFQGRFGEASNYWCYVLKIPVGVLMIWLMRPFVLEMRWAISWEAVVVGVAVFVLWVGLDPFYPKLHQIHPSLGKPGQDWNPNVQFGAGSTLAWSFCIARILGSTLVVPPLEEAFYRSFVYRYVVRPDFMEVPIGLFRWTPFLATAAVFGFAHSEWLAGILCGFAYQGLVCWKNRLGDAMTAHAITNFLLGLWVVWKGAWQFW